MEALREFFGIGGFNREPEGYFSWQHITFVTALMVIMTALAIYFGLKNRHRDAKIKNKVLIWAAILIDGFELFKIVVNCISEKDPLNWVNDLPLFLCSIQLITIPVASFAKGRMKEAALDFVFIFGLLGAVLGTYAAGNNYAAYPVISFVNVVSGITHSISGFASLYIVISGMASMKMKNAPITYGIIGFFGVAAYIANIFTDRNYMFLSRGDGTPYDILYNIVNGNKIIYPLLVILLFVLWITILYFVFRGIRNKKRT